MFDKEVCIVIISRTPQTICFVYQIEYIWVCKWFQKDHTRSCLLHRKSQKPGCLRFYTYWYVPHFWLVSTQMLSSFPSQLRYLGTILGLYVFLLRVPAFSSILFSDFVQPVSCCVMTMEQERHILAVFFIDKPSVTVSVKCLICWPIIHCISCKDYMPIYWFLWLTVITTVCFIILSCKHILLHSRWLNSWLAGGVFVLVASWSTWIVVYTVQGKYSSFVGALQDLRCVAIQTVLLQMRLYALHKRSNKILGFMTVCFLAEVSAYVYIGLGSTAQG